MSLSCPNCGCVFERPHLPLEATRVASESSDGELTCPECGACVISDSLEPTVIVAPALMDRTGMRISHFVLLRRLGAGTFGEVWLAEDLTLGRQVAIKLPKRPGFESAFPLNEARTAASLKHDNIVRVLEVGHDGNQVFITSEFIDGMTLQDFLTKGKPPEYRVLELLVAISDALDYAHTAGVIHRDVKPANILLSKSGRPYVTDFGIARRISADATISHEGQVIGTARYMSPEQASGKSKETDRRSDIYSIGVMLFEMLTGDLPFRGNLQAILHQKTVEDAPSPRKLNPDISRDLETICLKCLEREPGRRYATAREVAEELQRVQVGEPIRARPVSRFERVVRWCRRRPVVAGLLASLFLSLSFGLSGVTYFWLRAEERGNAARRSLYHSWMNLASVHLGNGDYTGVKQLLERVSADPAMRKQQGFESDYFDAVTAPLHLVANHGDTVRDVALSRESGLVASIGVDSGIRVWDVETGDRVRTLNVEGVRFQSLEFSPAASLLASGGADGYVRIWQPANHDRTVLEMLHGPPVALVRFSPSGKQVLSAGKSGAVRLWDTSKGEMIAEIPTGKRGETRDIRFSPDGERLYVASQDGHIRVWNLAQIKTEMKPEREFDIAQLLECMAISDDGQTLVAGNFFGHLTIRSLTDGQESTYRSHWGRIDDLEFVKGTRLVMLVSSDGKLHVYDLNQQHEVRTLDTHGLSTGMLARSADGVSLAIGSGDGAVTHLKVAEIRRPQIYWHENAVRDLVFLPDTREIVEIDDIGAIRRWNLERGDATELLVDAERRFRRMAVGPNGALLAFGGVGPTVAIWDRKQSAVVHELPVAPAGAVALQFSPDGKRLAIASRKGRLLGYQTDDWSRPEFEIDGTADMVRAIEFSGDGTTLAVARGDSEVQLLNPTNGQPRWPTITVSSEPSALRFCEENRLLAIATTGGEIHLWDMQEQRPRFVIKGHTGRINTLVCLPDRQVLVSGGRDRDLKLWDLTSAELITPLSGHSRQVFALAVAPDGRTLYSGGLDGEIRVWKSRKGE